MITDILDIYFKIILEFILELFVFYAIIFYGFKRKPNFILRTLFGLVIILGVGFFSAFMYSLIGDNVFGRTFIYVILFVVSLIPLKMLFSENLQIIIFCGSMAYALQNLCYKIYLTIWYLGESTGAFPDTFYGMGLVIGDIIFRLYYYSVYAVLYVVAYFAFIRLIKKHLYSVNIKKTVFVFAVAVLFITVFLCSAQDIFSTELNLVLKLSGNGFSVVSCVCVLALLSTTLIKNDLSREVLYLNRLIYEKERQFGV